MQRPPDVPRTWTVVLLVAIQLAVFVLIVPLTDYSFAGFFLLGFSLMLLYSLWLGQRWAYIFLLTSVFLFLIAVVPISLALEDVSRLGAVSGLLAAIVQLYLLAHRKTRAFVFEQGADREVSPLRLAVIALRGAVLIALAVVAPVLWALGLDIMLLVVFVGLLVVLGAALMFLGPPSFRPSRISQAA